MSTKRMRFDPPSLPWFLVLLGLGLVACAKQEVSPYCEDCNVVLVMADTLRADHLDAYGYGRPTSPFVSQLAEEGTLFLNARSQSACTFPSANSLLTSRHTFDFLDRATRPAIPEGIPSLATILQDRSFATLAVSASPIVRATPSEFNPKGGFGAGFEVFDESCLWREAPCVTEVAAKHLQTWSKVPQRRPFFLYVHYMDPHDPYAPQPEIRGTFSSPYEGPTPYIAAGRPNPLQTALREKDTEIPLAPGDLEHLVDLYDEEILSFDRGFEALVEELRSLGVLDDTLIVLVSDHGESFLEHNEIKHCNHVYESETRVPLIFRLPGKVQSGRRSEPVQNLDVVPTILDLLHIERQDLRLAGRSLVPLLSGKSLREPTYAFSAMSIYRSVNDQRFKLIMDLDPVRYQLFDLQNDPQEAENVLWGHRRAFHRLREQLFRWAEEAEGEEVMEERLKRAEELEEELRALGYIG